MKKLAAVTNRREVYKEGERGGVGFLLFFANALPYGLFLIPNKYQEWDVPKNL